MTPRAPIRRPIAVLLSRFPLITETFILREVIELERQGQPVVLVPLIREHPVVVHEEAKPWVQRALYTPYFSPAIGASVLRAAFTSLPTLMRLLAWIVRGAVLHPPMLAKSLAILPKSLHLAERLRDLGVAHVHAHFATHPATAAAIIRACSGISYSFTAHAHDIFVDRTLLREKIRDAAFIRAISAFNRRFLESLYGPLAAERTAVIHVGVETAAYAAGAAPSPGGPLRLICIAALKPYKGIPVLVEACRILAAEGVDVSCDIIGTGPLRGRLRAAIVKGGLHDRVRLRGALPQHVVADALSQADLFVLPSVVAPDGQMEGIPVALMEAMAAQKPVVATSISGIPELVEHLVTGLLVDPSNPLQLANAIRCLADDPALRARLAAAGRERVQREFELRSCVAQLLASIDAYAAPAAPEYAALIDQTIGAGCGVGVRAVRRSPDALTLEVCRAGDEPREIVIKQHRARQGQSRPPQVRARQEYETLLAVNAHFAQDERLGAPRPLGSFPAVAGLAMTRARGLPLSAIIREARYGGSADVETLRHAAAGAGAWLHRFQEMAHGDGSDALAALADRASADASRIGLAGHLRSRIATLRDEVAARAPVAVSHHGDFWPGNIYYAGDGRVEVIDFEGYGFSLPGHDLAWFLLHTALYFALRGRRLMQIVRDSFFGAYASPLDPAELELCRLATAISLAARSPSGARRARLARWRVLRAELAR